MALTGAFLGLVFGLTAVTNEFMQRIILQHDAERFARELVPIIKEGPNDLTLAYTLLPGQRAGKTPEELIQLARDEDEKLKPAARTEPDPRKPPDPGEMMRIQQEKMKREENQRADSMREGMLRAPLRRLKLRLALPSESFRFDRIEGTAVDDKVAEAAAVYKVEGPGSEEFPEKTQHVLLVLKSNAFGPRYEWMISLILFPYKPMSYALGTTPVQGEEEHGHSH
jgi:hypothetical protein